MRVFMGCAGLVFLAGCGGKTVETGDPSAGRVSFVEQGCVMCHSVNGIGGKVAPALDAGEETLADPYDFAARVLSGAYAMSALQKAELGYAITLTGQELRDIAAFAGSPSAQSKLEYEDVPASMRQAFLNEAFWEVPDLSDFLPKEDDGEEDESQ